MYNKAYLRTLTDMCSNTTRGEPGTRTLSSPH